MNRHIQRKIKADQRKSAPSVKVERQSELEIIISEQTIGRRLHEVGLFGGVTQKKKNHISIRLIVVSVLHSSKHIGKHLLASGIMSCGQMKVNLTCLDRMGKLWFGECRRKSSIQNVLCQPQSILGRNVKCSGCFSITGAGTLVFIDGNMTGNMYRDILEKNLFKSVKKLNWGNKRMFQLDNDPKHRSNVVSHWLDQNGVERVKWPSCSPIEHIWDELER